MGFGYNQSRSQQEQSNGLTPGVRSYFSNMTPQYFTQADQLSQQAAADPGGLAYQSTVDQLMPTGKYGTAASGDAGVYQLGRDLFTQAAGSRVQRGFRSPNNLEAVLGDSLRMASGQLVPLAQQWAQQRAALAPTLRQASFGYAMTPMQTLQNLLASSGSGSGNSSSFGFQGQIGDKTAAAMLA